MESTLEIVHNYHISYSDILLPKCALFCHFLGLKLVISWSIFFLSLHLKNVTCFSFLLVFVSLSWTGVGIEK